MHAIPKTITFHPENHHLSSRKPSPNRPQTLVQHRFRKPKRIKDVVIKNTTNTAPCCCLHFSNPIDSQNLPHILFK
jgi:hypothetical protein